MSRIEVLPESVARRIAAGEVIERPASVVKELVENSLDAGASTVVVELEQGGSLRIAVTDDGEGISKEDLPLAFRPHATSKIRKEEDLLRISTLGFRGEALPSIAAVSEVEIWTRRRESSEGANLRIRGGIPLPVEDTGTAPGCRVEVRDLFFNTPVRRKFLKSTATEASHVAQLVGRIALANPEVAFTLRHNGRETLSLARGDLRTRIRRLLGPEIDAALHPISLQGAVAVEGFATHPHYSAANSRDIVWFVNRRWVRDRMLQHALLAAYATLIPHGRYPAAVVHLVVSPDQVDVNVHPAKTEIRFRSSQSIYEALQRVVREAFGRHVEPTGVAGAGAIAEPTGGYGRVEGEPGRLRLVAVAPRHQPPADLFASDGPLSRLRIVGQVFDGYLVCQDQDAVVLIDQHAAHERVAFEQLLEKRRQGRIETQPLLIPQTIELSPGEAGLVVDSAGELRELGLEIESFGEGAVIVRSVPALLPPADLAPLVRAIAAELEEVGRSRTLEHRTEDLLATIACHSVVRVGQSLSETEIRGLLAAMDRIDLSTNCPHGRPVTVTLSRTELERRFGR